MEKLGLGAGGSWVKPAWGVVDVPEPSTHVAAWQQNFSSCFWPLPVLPGPGGQCPLQDLGQWNGLRGPSRPSSLELRPGLHPDPSGHGLLCSLQPEVFFLEGVTAAAAEESTASSLSLASVPTRHLP